MGSNPLLKTPYYYTKTAIETSMNEIASLLKKHGSKGYRWTNIAEEEIVLEFILNSTDDSGKNIEFRVRPPLLMKIDGSPNVLQSMRFLKHWIKAKLEAVSYGFVSEEEEFLPYIVGFLASGEPTTVGEILIPQIKEGRLGAGDLVKALPSGKDDEDEE